VINVELTRQAQLSGSGRRGGCLGCDAPLLKIWAQRPHLRGVSQDKYTEAKRQHQMFKGSTKILPEGGVRARVVYGEEQGEHVDRSTNAREAHQDAGHQRETNGQLTVRDEKRDGSRMRQDEFCKMGTMNG
jgi:hypothetical protein